MFKTPAHIKKTGKAAEDKEALIDTPVDINDDSVQVSLVYINTGTSYLTKTLLITTILGQK